MIDDEILAAMNTRASRLGYQSSEEWLRDILDLPAETRRPTAGDDRPQMEKVFETKLGAIWAADSLHYMQEEMEDNSVDLIVTSPPFCLLTKKEYGNEEAHEYLRWFSAFGREFHRILRPNGSLVIDVGASWVRGIPTRNPYQFELLLQLIERHKFYLAQDVYWWNPSRIPSPAEWVTIRRVRLKDAINTVWWLSPTPYPKSNNLRVLSEYGPDQKAILKGGKFNPGKRPSGHDVSKDGFKKNNGGAIPPNLLAIANTESNSSFQKHLKAHDLRQHPARFPVELPEFFINLLTNKDDLVFDPFGGSCTTGEAAERLGRRWICCELDPDYAMAGAARFTNMPDKRRKLGPYEIPAPRLSNNSRRVAQHGGRTRSRRSKKDQIPEA